MEVYVDDMVVISHTGWRTCPRPWGNLSPIP